MVGYSEIYQRRSEDIVLFMTSILPPLIIVKESMGFKEEFYGMAKLIEGCSK